MVEVLKNNITHDFDNICFNLVDWDAVLKDSSEVLIFHLKSTIEFSVSYHKGENLSFVLYDHNKAVGVFPLFIHKNEGYWLISGDGENLIRPLFIDGIARKVKKRLEKKILSIVYFISNQLKIKKVKLFDANMVLSSWYMLWLGRANNIFVTHQLAIDLKLTIDVIKLGLEKCWGLVSKENIEMRLTNNYFGYKEIGPVKHYSTKTNKYIDAIKIEFHKDDWLIRAENLSKKHPDFFQIT